MNEELKVEHRPHCVSQVASCSGKEHAMHRELTGMVLYYCNCGYSSGWIDRDFVPVPTEFIRNHLPPGVTIPWQKEETA